MSVSSEPVDNFRVNVGRYFDGETARAQSVTVKLDADGLCLRRQKAPDILWSIAATRLVGPYKPGEWFTLVHREKVATRLHLPPRMYQRLVDVYGPPLVASPLRSVQAYIFPVLAFAAWLGALMGLVSPWMAREVAGWHASETVVQIAQRQLDARIDRMNRSRRSGARFCVDPEGLKALGILSEVIAGLPSQKFTPYFLVMRDSRVNAHSYGAGYAILNSGLIDTVRNEAELISVMAHEMGHGEGRHHSRSNIEAAVVSTFADVLLRSQGNAYGLVLTGRAIFDSFRSQEMEREADRFAILQMQQAEIDPAAGGEFMRRMAEQDGEVGFFSTHPTYAERAALFAVGSRPGLPLLTADQWRALKSICRTVTKTAPPSPARPSS